MVDFYESGMHFSFADERVFHIETCSAYVEQLRMRGICSVECVALRGKEQVLFIEAKSSAPSPNGAGTNFQDFMQQIYDKSLHSLQLCYSILAGIYDGQQSAIGSLLAERLQHQPKVLFLVIVRQHEVSWCPPLQDALRREMRHILRLWKADVMVINERMARAKGVILPS